MNLIMIKIRRFLTKNKQKRQKNDQKQPKLIKNWGFFDKNGFKLSSYKICQILNFK